VGKGLKVLNRIYWGFVAIEVLSAVFTSSGDRVGNAVAISFVSVLLWLIAFSVILFIRRIRNGERLAITKTDLAVLSRVALGVWAAKKVSKMR
jgi:hypothetical protein